MKNKWQLSFAFCLCASAFAFGQDKDADFTYEKNGDISDNVDFLEMEISPLKIGYQGGNIAFGLGARINVSDIQNKFSFRAKYDFNYHNEPLSELPLEIVVEDYTRKTTNFLGVNIGYNIKTRTATEALSTRVDTGRKVEYYAEFPTKVIYRNELRVGFDRVSLLSRGSLTYQDTAYSDGTAFLSDYTGQYLLNQRNDIISLGFAKKTSTHSKFKTSKYGDQLISKERMIYGDVLFGLGITLPPLHRLVSDPDDLSPVQSLQAFDSFAQTAAEEGFFKLPAGVRFGMRQGSRKLHNFSWNLEVALYPGYFTSVLDVTHIQAGVSYQFLKTLRE